MTTNVDDMITGGGFSGGTSSDVQDKDTVYLVDGDIICYRSAAATDGRKYQLIESIDADDVILDTFKYQKDAKVALEKIQQQDPGGAFSIELMYTPEPVAHALHNVKQLIESIAGPTATYEVFLTEGKTFREEAYPEYKQNRKDMRRPRHLEACKTYLRKHYDAIAEGAYEADDLIGIRAKAMRGLGESYVVVSSDKDLDMIPGMHMKIPPKGTYKVGTIDATRHFYTQILTGDKTDNIPGLHRVGPKTAEKILGKVEQPCASEFYKAVVKEYAERLPREDGEDDLTFYVRVLKTVRDNARQLWILDKPLEKDDEGEYQLWNPPEI